MAKISRLLLCSCEGTMALDPGAASRALGDVEVQVAERLCTDEQQMAEAALSQEGATMIACGQMAALFKELSEDIGAPGIVFTVDVRDRAGWTADRTATAKQSALLAEAALAVPATPSKDVVSEGTCLILGEADTALAAAQALAPTLAVTCLISGDPGDITPTAAYDVALGQLKTARGSLGEFEIAVDRYQQLSPGGRGAGHFGDPVDGAKSVCDIIVDLRGEGPLFAADHKRDGYVRADPRDPLSVQAALAEARDLQGVFEKPLYVRFDESICAHSRASRPGCDRCLSVCPTGAIVPDGDVVAIDPNICAGCGACAAVCPSGAASYDDPPVSHLFLRLRTLASAYRAAGGGAPRLLFHDLEYGGEMIRLSARFGRGLPADVIPVAVPSVEGVGHAETLAALGVGFASVSLLPGSRTDLTVPKREQTLASAIAGDASRIAVLDVADPEALEEALYQPAPPPMTSEPILPLGNRREVSRVAASAINPSEAPIALPEGAPYGAVVINAEACTLCLACVSLCPVGALGDNPDKPQVRFQETACLQCGICSSTCPEDAITLTPQLNLAASALTHQVLHEEEPFECIECGKPFGVKSTIDRIVEKLEGQHWMYTQSDNVKLIQMCDDCRVNAQYHQESSPFRMGERPQVRTTDDYLKDKKPN